MFCGFIFYFFINKKFKKKNVFKNLTTLEYKKSTNNFFSFFTAIYLNSINVINVTNFILLFYLLTKKH